MSIRAKSLLIICLTVFGVVTITYLSSRAILSRSSIRLEEQYARESTLHVRDVLLGDCKNMEGITSNWAIWDDAYQFVEDRNAAFIDSNMVDLTFTELHINLMVFVDRAGKVVYAKQFHPNDPHISLDDRCQTLLTQPTSLVRHTGHASAYLGIVMMADGPMMVTSRPILPSDGIGPVRGALIFGRYLTPDVIKRLAIDQHLSVNVYPLTTPLPADCQRALQRISTSQPVVVDAVSAQTIVGYTHIQDINRKSVLLLRVQRARTIYQQSQTTIFVLLIALAGIGFASSLLALGLLHRTVLSRLTQFCSSMLTVGASGHLSARIPTEGNDELVIVAKSVNDMLTSLEHSQEALCQQEALRESEHRYRQLVELSPDGVIILDDGRCVLINAAGLRLLGRQDWRQLTEQPMAEFVHREDRVRFIELIQGSLAQEGEHRYEMRFLRPDGEAVDVEIAVTAFAYQNTPAVQLVAHDITERKQSAERLNYLAYHDALTGLPNRLLFNDRLQHALAWAQRKGSQVAVMVLDLDRFKDVNDTLGHAVGDRLLQAVAARISGSMRSTDAIARIGGDEFFLFFHEVNDRQAVEQVTNRVFEQFAQPFLVDGNEMYVSASIGVSVYPVDADDIETLVKDADMAMYRAKTQGRNGYQFFSHEMETLASVRHTLSLFLRKAIEQEEVLVHYQPQIELATGRLIGVEALARFLHPELGVIAPEQFIPVAEETGLIMQLDELVLAKACRQLSAWRRQGMPSFHVAVNLSAHIFKQQQLTDRIMYTIERNGLAAHDLEIEITESTAVEDVERSLGVLTALHQAGVRIALDDFGTGYSSFGYLQRFPIDTLKIDRIFFQDILDNPDNVTIVNAIVVMAQALGLQTLAEGIETKEQAAFLQTLTCHIAQGHYYSVPLTAEQFTERYKAGSTTGTRSIIHGAY